VARLSVGDIVRRLLLYFGLAFAFLAVFAIFFALVVRTGHAADMDAAFSGGWIGLAIYTALLFWIIVRQSREYWQYVGFWLAVAGLLAVHLMAFVVILRSFSTWRVIWFMPIVIVEAGMFGAILFLLFSGRKRRRNGLNSH
jgi:apolipoprotein N-acyltransferase